MDKFTILAALALGLDAEAVDDLTVALRLDTNCREALVLRSRVYAAAGRSVEAEADRRAALELNAASR